MRARGVCLNTALLVVSLLVAALLAEGLLRLVAPKYQYAAETEWDFDDFRLFVHKPNSVGVRQHPDTGAAHVVAHNNLALRQHRNFTDANLDGSTIISFFGDSFTENSRMPVQYSFTEPLDYLLNTKSKRNYTVLNFGVDGYGPDQGYIAYMSSDVAKRSNHVFYVFCSNDIRNIYESNLLFVDGQGRLQRNESQRPSWLARSLSKLYLTYLGLEVRSIVRAMFAGTLKKEYSAADVLGHQARRDHGERIHSPAADEIQDEFESGRLENIGDQIKLFMAILTEWEKAVEEHGGQFHIVLLPRREEEVAYNLLREDFSVVDLYRRFNAMMDGYSYEKVRFRRDGHWNETGNMLAAVALYEDLQSSLDLPPADSGAAFERLKTYYAAFAGWYPPALGVRPKVDADEARRIRERYIPLELERDGRGHGRDERVS